MDPYDTSEFSGLSFESEFDDFLRLPASVGTDAGDNGATSASSYHHPGFGQPGGRDNQCPGCAKYKMDLDRMNHDHKINFQLLKKKIINTDLVLRKLKEQKDDCDLSRAETEECKRKLDQARRDSDILSQQLSSAMANIKPLEEEKDRLKTQLDLKSRQVNELNDRIEGDRALKLQRTAQDDYNRNLEVEVSKLKKNNTTLNSKNRSLTSKVKDLAADKKCLMCSKSVVERRLDNMAVALHEAQEQCLAFWEKLRQHDLAAGEKRPNFILSGFKSLVRRAVDKKNGIFTEPSTAYHAASDEDDNGGGRGDNSDWDNISDVESSDDDVTPQKGVSDYDRPGTSKTDTVLPASNESAVTSQVQQRTRKQVESETKALPELKTNLHKLPQSSAEISSQNHLSKLSNHEDSQKVIENTTCILSHSKTVVSTADHLHKPVVSEIGTAPPKNLEMSSKLSETMKIASEGKKKDDGGSMSDRSKKDSIASTESKRDQKGRTNLNQKLPETVKLVPESSSISDRSKGKSIMSRNNKLDQVDRTNLDHNRKNGDVHSLDDSLSSLSSLSSSDDDRDDANCIDQFLNSGTACSKGKDKCLDLDAALSFFEIEKLLSPLSVSPRPVSSLSLRSMSPLQSRPVSPLLPHPVSLLPLQAETELSASPHPAGSPVSLLADIDCTEEDDTVADCLFANGSVLSDSQSPLHGDDWEKMSFSDTATLKIVPTGAVMRAKLALGGGGDQNLTVSRSQSVGFIPVTNETGDLPDVADKSISNSVSGVSTLADVYIPEDVSDAVTLTDSCVLENVSINETLVDKSDSEHSSNNATVLDHIIAENICNTTADTGRMGADLALDVNTCVEIYILKSGTPNTLDKLSTQSEVEIGMADTCDSKSVIEETQASDMEVDLPQIDQLLNTHNLRLSPPSQTQHSLETQFLDLKSPLSQTQQSLDTQSLGLKSPLSQTQQSLDTQSFSLKSPLSQVQFLDTQSLDLKSPLFQTQQFVDTQSLGLKTSLSQTQQSLDTQSLGLKSPLSQAHQSLETQCLGLKSPLSQIQQFKDTQSLSPLSQTQQCLETPSLGLKSPVSQTQQFVDTQSLGLKSPLSQTQQSSDTHSLGLKSPLSQTQQFVDTQSLGLKSPLSQTQQSSDTHSLGLKSPLSQTQQSLDTQSLGLKSPLSQTQQSSDTHSLGLKSPLSQAHQSLERQSLGLKSPLSQTQQSLETQSLGLKSPLSQTQQFVDTQSLGLKSPLSQTQQSSDTQSLGLKSPLSQTQQSLDTQSLGLKSSLSQIQQVEDTQSSSPLSQAHQSLERQSLGLKSPLSQIQQVEDTQSSSPLSQAQQSLETQSLGLKSPLSQTQQFEDTESVCLKSPLFQIQQSLDTQAMDLCLKSLLHLNSPSSTLSHTNQTLEIQSLGLKSPLSQAQQSLETQSLDFISPSPLLPQINQPLDTESLHLKSPPLPLLQINQSLDTESLDLKSPPPPLLQINQSLVIESLDLNSPSSPLPETHQSLDTESLDLKSPPPSLLHINQSLGTESLDLKSPTPPVLQINQSLDIESVDLKSPSKHQSLNSQGCSIKSPTALPQMHQSINSQDSNIKSPSLSQVHQSLNTKAPDMLLSAIPKIHPSLDTEILDIKSSSAVPELQQSVKTATTDIKLSSSVPDVHSSLNTTKLSPSIMPDVCPSLKTKVTDIPTVSQVHHPPITKASDIMSTTTSCTHPPLDRETLDINSSTLAQVHHSGNTEASDIKSTAVPKSLKTSHIKSSSVVHQPSNTKASHIKSAATVPQVHQSLKTNISDHKSSSVLSEVHHSLNTKASEILCSTIPHIHSSLDAQTFGIESSSTFHKSSVHDSDLTPPSAKHQKHQPTNTQSSSAVPQIDPSVDSETSDIKSPSGVDQTSINNSDITSSSAELHMDQPPNTKAAQIKSSPVPQGHKSLKTKDSSATPQINSSSDTATLDIKSLSTQDSVKKKASSVIPQMHQPTKTKANDIKLSPPVAQVRQSLKRKASDIKLSPPVAQVRQSSKRKASDKKSSPPVAQVCQSLKRKASTIPHIAPSLGSQDSDTKSPSVLPQSPQSVLLDIFNFFSLPPRLSPLPPSPPPRKQNEDKPIKFKAAAPENVPKVTPLAQVKKQATVGNSSSMSAQIIEARKLLAKRKAAVLVKPTPITNGAERKRSSALAGISPAGPAKRRKLANLSGFPNANDAVMYDLRQYLTAKDLDLKMTAETMLSRFLDGNTKAAWEVLCQAIISFLNSTNQDVLIHLISACEKEGVIDTVFIREEERRLVLLISAFWRLDESLDRRQLMGKIWTVIFNRGCSNQLVRLSYCRMFTSLCLEQGDIEQVRILVYSIAWCDYLDLVHPLMAIVGVWPQVLADTHDKLSQLNRVSKYCIRDVLGFMLREKCKADSSLLQKVTLVIQKVCQFDLGKIEESADKLLKSLMLQLQRKCLHIIKYITEDNTFDTMKTIELLLVYQGPEWTEKHFIHSNLVSLSMKWAIKKLNKAEYPDMYITCLIRIFRAVIAVQTPSVGTVGVVLGSVFPHFLNSTATESDMMFTCIDTLLELAPHNLKKSLNVLNTWKATQNNIPAETESKIQEVQSMLTETVPKKRAYKRKKHKKPK